MSTDTDLLDRRLREAMKLNAAAEAATVAERIAAMRRDFPRIHPNMTVAQIAALCAELSTVELEVVARIECIGSAPIAYLQRVPVHELPPSYLRHSPTTPGV